MTWTRLQIGSMVLKTTEAMTLAKTHRSLVEIAKDSLAVGIEAGGRHEGYVFHGHGKMLLDMIIETEEGALGSSVEKETNDLYLMLGDTSQLQSCLISATNDDLLKMGHKDRQEFQTKARVIVNQFAGETGVEGFQCSGRFDGIEFAFPRGSGKFDVLLAEKSKLVYRASSVLFVSDLNDAVLKNGELIAVSGQGRSCIVNTKCFRH
jgi:hypothetical protein